MSELELEANEPRRKKGKINKDKHAKEMMKITRSKGECLLQIQAY